MNKSIIFSGLFASLILIVSGCAPGQFPKELSFTPVTGISPQFDGISSSYVITNQDDWEKLNPSESIDFTREMVIVAFNGIKNTGGYSIQVTKIVENQQNVEVFVKEISPGRNCIVTMALTSPYQAVKTARVDKPVGFKLEKEVREC